ncbi:MAG: hypothetical protein ACM3JC_08200 [Rudaea sp.]
MLGALAVVVCAAGGWFDPDAFFQAWLVNWLFLLGISLAAMMDVMIHELTGGRWGRVLRPPLEAAMSALPFVALLAIPLAFGLPDLFAWARPDDVAASASLQAKQWFLNTPQFLARNALWLVVWSAFALQLRRRLATDSEADVRARRRLSVAGLLVYLATITLFAYDFVASLVPDWSSTAVGVRLGVAQFVAAFGFAVPFAVLDARARRKAPAATARDFQDFGNLLLTFAMMWAYIAFTQYLIVWAEDLPRETSWYWPRVATNWRWLALAIALLNFALPVVAMLFRGIKRNGNALAAVCGLALIGQWLDCLWLIAPSLRPDGFSVHWLDVAALVAQGGLWLALVVAIAERALTAPAPRVEGVPARG